MMGEPILQMYSLASNSRPLYPSVEALLTDAAVKDHLRELSPAHSEQDTIFRELRQNLTDLFSRVPPDDVMFCFDEDYERVVAFRPSKSVFAGACIDVRLFLNEGQFASRASSRPRGAKLLLVLIPRKNREHLLGDIEEEYRTIVLPEFGTSRATLWLWWQVMISLAPLVGAQIRKTIDAARLFWKR
jgi:hypothetical protein